MSQKHHRQVTAFGALREQLEALRFLCRKGACLNLLRKRQATLAAEPGARVVERTTGGAALRQRCAAKDAEPIAGSGLGTAARTLHGLPREGSSLINLARARTSITIPMARPAGERPDTRRRRGRFGLGVALAKA